MKNIFLSIALLISVFLIQVECSAQVRTVNGMVFTFDSIPLAHVDIKVKSSRLEVKSDTTGRFSVQCNPEDILILTAHGFYSQKVKLNEKSKVVIVNLKMKSGERIILYTDGVIDNFGPKGNFSSNIAT